MTEKTKKFIEYIISKNILVKEVVYNFRYDILFKDRLIAIILCEDKNDCIYLIFDIKNYLMEFNTRYNIFGYYNIHEKIEKRKCIHYIKKEINKHKRI